MFSFLLVDLLQTRALRDHLTWEEQLFEVIKTTCDSFKSLEDKLFFGDICKVDFDIHIIIVEAKKWSIILKYS